MNDLSPDALYNMGNCQYKLGEPGIAALHYHRALAADENHRESHQNLKFLAKTYQPSLAQKPSWFQSNVAKLNKSTYIQITYACYWVIGLSTLTLLIYNLRSWSQLIIILAPIFAVIVLICAYVGIYSYPKSIQYAPIETLAVVTPTGHSLYSSPISSENGKNIMSTLNPSTLCKIIAQRNKWTYVELPDYTRGWVKKETVTPIATAE